MHRFLPVLAIAGLTATSASAAFVIEIDTDGTTAGNSVAFNPNFAFGGNTSTASVGGAPSRTPGVVAIGTGNSIFGGNGSPADVYTYAYTPAADGDNNQEQGFFNTRGDRTSGLSAGSSGGYDVYAIWPTSTNQSGQPSTWTLSDASGALFSTTINQNGLTDWVKLGSATLDAGTAYTLTQAASDSTFVSQRAHSVLFEATSIAPIPEPATAALALGGLALLAGRRRA